MFKQVIKRLTHVPAIAGLRGRLQDRLQIDISFREPPKPKISVVVVVYNIPDQARHTLLSLSARCQKHIAPGDYEVLVIDNGSTPPLDAGMVTSFGSNFRLIRIDQAAPSPAAAANRGIAEAKADVIGIMVDGARIASPGLLHFARHGVGLYERSITGAIGWYLGHDYQRWGLKTGYDRDQEGRLLASINWPEDGYRLFEISTMDESSVDGWLSPIAELNALFASRRTWDLLGGLDERFDLPGGGLVNLDVFRRAVELPDAQLVLMLGEATFHQLHGGVATNSSPENAKTNWDVWAAQYERIRGQAYALPQLANPVTYIGRLPQPALARFVRAAVEPANLYGTPPPLGEGFDLSLWTAQPTPRSPDPIVAQLIDIAQQQFRERNFATCAAVSRLVRMRAPSEPEAGRLLSLVSPWLPTEAAPYPPREEHHLVLAEACQLLGEDAIANDNARIASEIAQSNAQ